MYGITSGKGVEGKGTYLCNFGNKRDLRLKAKGNACKHCTVADKVVSRSGVGKHLKLLYKYITIEQFNG